MYEYATAFIATLAFFGALIKFLSYCNEVKKDPSKNKFPFPQLLLLVAGIALFFGTCNSCNEVEKKSLAKEKKVLTFVRDSLEYANDSLTLLITKSIKRDADTLKNNLDSVTTIANMNYDSIVTVLGTQQRLITLNNQFNQQLEKSLRRRSMELEKIDEMNTLLTESNRIAQTELDNNSANPNIYSPSLKFVYSDSTETSFKLKVRNIGKRELDSLKLDVFFVYNDSLFKPITYHHTSKPKSSIPPNSTSSLTITSYSVDLEKIRNANFISLKIIIKGVDYNTRKPVERTFYFFTNTFHNKFSSTLGDHLRITKELLSDSNNIIRIESFPNNRIVTSRKLR